MTKHRKIKPVETPVVEKESSYMAEFDPEDVKQEIVEEVESQFPFLNFKTRLAKRQKGHTRLYFKFDELPPMHIQTAIKNICKPFQGLVWHESKHYSRYELNFIVVFQTNEEEETDATDKDNVVHG